LQLHLPAKLGEPWELANVPFAGMHNDFGLGDRAPAALAQFADLEIPQRPLASIA
jgi:hypothetical protein